MASDKDKLDKAEISKNKANLNIQMDIEILSDQTEPVEIKSWVDRIHAKINLMVHLGVFSMDEAELIEEDLKNARKVASAKIKKVTPNL